MRANALRKRSRPREAPSRGGWTFFLSLLAALPAALLFVAGPFVGARPRDLPLVHFAFVFVTPFVAFLALFARFKPPRAEGGAAAAGSVLAGITAIAWLVYATLAALFGGPP